MFWICLKKKKKKKEMADICAINKQFKKMV